MEQDQEKPKLRKVVVERIITLILSGFGLVAALAWNDAIQSLFKTIFGDAGSIVAKFSYAVFITILITIVSIRLSRWGGEDR